MVVTDSSLLGGKNRFKCGLERSDTGLDDAPQESVIDCPIAVHDAVPSIHNPPEIGDKVGDFRIEGLCLFQRFADDFDQLVDDQF